MDVFGRPAIIALYGEIGDNLYRLTADFADDVLSLQWVVAHGITEDEIEGYRCVGTELLAHFSSATIEEEFLKVGGPGEVRAMQPLPIALFCRKLERKD